MADPTIGVQFWPWHGLEKMLAYGRKALECYPFDYIWAADEFMYEDTTTFLTALAMELDVSVGPLVTFPWRNPLELAQRFGSMSKLTRPGRSVAIGIGAGGISKKVISETTNPISVVRESLIMLRALLGGDEIDLAEFPDLAARFRHNMEMKTSLHFPPANRVPVYLAVAGVPMAKLAGKHGDGAVFTQVAVRTSYRGTKHGFLAKIAQALDESRAAAGDDRPFDKMMNLSCSISRDGEKARQYAKRQTSIGLTGAYLRYPDVLDELGLDREEAAHIADAYIKGRDLNEAARRVSDKLLAEVGSVNAGTPEEVIPRLREMMSIARGVGINHFVFGVPLGPDVPEALELLGSEVIPAVLA